MTIARASSSVQQVQRPPLKACKMKRSLIKASTELQTPQLSSHTSTWKEVSGVQLKANKDPTSDENFYREEGY